MSEWVIDQGKYYYLNEKGVMMANTTAPDGYLVSTDGRWVTDRQVTGGYVKTPYDNQPYQYDSDWRRYIFDEETDYAWVSDHRVLSAVIGILTVSELSEQNKAVYDELYRFLNGFDYGASDYEKAKQVYEEITRRAVFVKMKLICGMRSM